jgi:nitrite reductase/ring-hydroxylating ferredoxin subunit
MDTRPSELAERAAEAIERQDRLRPVEDALQRAIAALFRSGGAAGGVAKNALHGTWLGHPLHPVLTDVPLGAWTVALVLDGLEAHAGERRWGRAAEGAVGIGIAGALAAALAGITDWQHTEDAPRRSGLAHAALNTLALGLYAGSLLLRRRGARRAGRGLAGAGFAVLVGAAYLGGRLVYHHRVGVDHAQREATGDFVRALRVSELREGEPRPATVGGVRIVLVRRAERIHALGELCSHRGGPLAEGEARGTSLVCPWHGSRFALEDGRVLDGPATMPQPCFETRVRDGWVEVRGPLERGHAAA